MKIEMFNNQPDGLPWGWLILWGMIWLGVLWRILTRSDFDTPLKTLWVIVVIFVPLFGVFLYWFAASSPASDTAYSGEHRIIPGSDVSGTPWADNPNFTDKGK
ncbi:MAG: PLD nuclease N-terminal domain-containing protein [Verrucomicrobiota bacterium]